MQRAVMTRQKVQRRAGCELRCRQIDQIRSIDADHDHERQQQREGRGAEPPCQHPGQRRAPREQQPQCDQAQPRHADERHGGHLGGYRQPGREPQTQRRGERRGFEPAQQQVQRQHGHRGDRHVERHHGGVSENHRRRDQEQQRHQRRGLVVPATHPHPAGRQQQQQERQHAEPGQRQDLVVAGRGVVQQVAALRLADRHRVAVESRSGQIRSDGSGQPRQRRMLVVVAILAAIDQHQPGSDMLGFIPEVAEDVIGADAQRARQHGEQRRRSQGPANRPVHLQQCSVGDGGGRACHSALRPAAVRSCSTRAGCYKPSDTPVLLNAVVARCASGSSAVGIRPVLSRDRRCSTRAMGSRWRTSLGAGAPTMGVAPRGAHRSGRHGAARRDHLNPPRIKRGAQVAPIRDIAGTGALK